jgi:predicted nucleic acid-binding protein
MLDTNIFDSLAKGSFATDRLPSDGKLCATRVQMEELKNSKNHDLRPRLLATFTEIVGAHEAMIAAALAFDIAGAGWGEGEWRSDGALWHSLKKDLDDAWDRKSKKQQKRSKKQNNLKDASIAGAAKFNDCILVTRDDDLATIAKKHGIEVLHLNYDGRRL